LLTQTARLELERIARSADAAAAMRDRAHREES
jgi:hypothetical protein